MNNYLLEVKEYIEATEQQIAQEWGSGQSYKQLIEDDDMPDVYYQTLQLIKDLEQ